MGFSFNPLLWFICGSCKEAFPNINLLKEHKVKQHLQDCLRIKCIVFEEKFVDDTWTPLNPNSTAQHSNWNWNAQPQFFPPNINQHSGQVQRLHNPYVFLGKRLPAALKPSTLPVKRKTYPAKRPKHHQEKSPPSKSQRSLPSTNSNEETQNQGSEFPEPVQYPITILKEEPEGIDAELSSGGEASTSPPTFSSTSNEVQTSNSNPAQLINEEFILPNFTQNSDTSYNIPPYASPGQAVQSNRTEENTDCGFEFQPTRNAASSVESEYSDPLVISPTPIPTTSNPLNSTKSDGKSKKQSIPDPEPDEESQSESESEQESVSGSAEETEEETNSDSESNANETSVTKPPTTNLYLELPLTQWLLLQKEENPSNVILIEPDPTLDPDFPPVSKTNVIQCKLCNLNFNSDSRLRSHVIWCFNFNKLRHHYCLICKKNFPRLGTHNRNEHSIKSKYLFKFHECSECSGKFTGRKQLEIHQSQTGHSGMSKKSVKRSTFVKRKGSSATFFPCPFCSESFPTTALLNSHTIIHPRTKLYKCSDKQCLASFDTMDGLMRHMRRHENQPCIDLEKNFDLDLPLLYWLLMQEETNPKNQILLEPDPKSLEDFQPVSENNIVKCKWCDECFATELDLRWHVSKCFIFNKEKHRYCQECDRSFCNSNYLRGHNSTIHSTDPRPTFKCSMCSKEFLQEKKLKVHEKRHEVHEDSEDDDSGDVEVIESAVQEESGDKSRERSRTNYQCRFCDRSFVVKCSLTSHERTHTGERPFKCDVGNCDKAYSIRRSLDKHRQRSHMEELGLPGFGCPICGKKYGDNYGMMQHVELHHYNATPFKCTFDDECDKAFRIKAQLDYHIRMKHTGEMPFQCGQCGKLFPLRGMLNKHVKQNH